MLEKHICPSTGGISGKYSCNAQTPSETAFAFLEVSRRRETKKTPVGDQKN
jgi:hypothetical protein